MSTTNPPPSSELERLAFVIEQNTEANSVRFEDHEARIKKLEQIENHVDQALGQSPDPATGQPGRGIRGQVSFLVEAETARAARRERFGRWLSFVSKLVALVGALIAILVAIKDCR